MEKTNNPNEYEIFFIKDGETLGPKLIADLLPLEINSQTFVWGKGLPDWVPASDFPALKEYLEMSPPPPPSSSYNLTPKLKLNLASKSNQTVSKYDHTYEKEYSASITGFIVLCFSFFLTTIDLRGDQTFYSMFVLFSFGARFLLAFYASGVAKRQNRESTSWGIFGFFLPSICLIILGLLPKKLLEKDSINPAGGSAEGALKDSNTSSKEEPRGPIPYTEDQETTDRTASAIGVIVIFIVVVLIVLVTYF